MRQFRVRRLLQNNEQEWNLTNMGGKWMLSIERLVDEDIKYLIQNYHKLEMTDEVRKAVDCEIKKSGLKSPAEIEQEKLDKETK